MIGKVVFDNKKYLREQTEAILKRIASFEHRLYLEFGGKLFNDYHAARVLPGYDPDVKLKLLRELRDKAAILLCIYAGDIERNKMRADFGITYDSDSMKMIDDLRGWGLDVLGVIITRFENQPSAVSFKNRLERRGVRVYTHRYTKGYPTDVDTIVSDEGYGANSYIESQKPLVVVTGPGPGSGKLATCLSQLYHDYRRGIKAGYAKFETFPIWNIPLKHPVNIAYEAAAADLGDFNLIDPFHLEAYDLKAVNYNRDVEAFPLLKRILEKIAGGETCYKSPTDMGVNRCGFAIVDDNAAGSAAKEEVIRRYFRYRCEYAAGLAERETVNRVELFISNFGLTPESRKVVQPARDAADKALEQNKGNERIYCGAAIELADGTIITGNNSQLMHAASSLVIHSIKHLAGIPENIKLLPQNITDSVGYLKTKILYETSVSLDLNESLVLLGISAITNTAAHLAIGKLKDLRGCEVHMTHMPTSGDEAGLRRLGVNMTSDPNFATKNLFIS